MYCTCLIHMRKISPHPCSRQDHEPGSQVSVQVNDLLTRLTRPRPAPSVTVCSSGPLYSRVESNCGAPWYPLLELQTEVHGEC